MTFIINRVVIISESDNLMNIMPFLKLILYKYPLKINDEEIEYVW